MEIDKTTLQDLTIFAHQEHGSVFSKFNFCTTTGGTDKLLENFNTPLSSIQQINDIQATLQFIAAKKDTWPVTITNGTVMVVEKFFVTGVEAIPQHATPFDAWTYKALHGPDYSFVSYSADHSFDFLKGIQIFIDELLNDNTPVPLRKLLQTAAKTIDKEELNIVKKHATAQQLNKAEKLRLMWFIRNRFKQQMFELLDIFSQLDAWYSMAVAIEKYGFVFPEIIHSDIPFLEGEGLYHILLEHPVDYNILLDQQKNFLFLTGANMAGKSTFIKSTGIAVYLAHLGLGVPAAKLKLSYFDGMLSNINVTDNILKGESYFYNEVQRIKSTVTKINDGRKWLILIDELFKGTNVQDAMKCSLSVIGGLVKMKQSLFILSTHLYEIADDLKQYPNILFNYFETRIIDNQLVFSFQLKEGISNDRLGYLILQKEGVVELLQKI